MKTQSAILATAPSPIFVYEAWKAKLAYYLSDSVDAISERRDIEAVRVSLSIAVECLKNPHPAIPGEKAESLARLGDEIEAIAADLSFHEQGKDAAAVSQCCSRTRLMVVAV